MAKKSIVIVKKNKRRERTIFTILCILIAILFVGNVLALIYILSKNSKHGSKSIISTDSGIIGYVKAGGEYTKNTIAFDNEIIFPGSDTTKSIRLENLSRGEKYIRIYAQLQIMLDDEFTTKDFVDISISNENWIKSADDKKLYYTKVLKGHEFVDFDITFEIRNDLGFDDFDTIYKNQPYKVNICVETRNTAVQLDSENIQISWEKGL